MDFLMVFNAWNILCWLTIRRKLKVKWKSKFHLESVWPRIFDFEQLFKVVLYKSTLKSAIIRVIKSVCLHGKQTTGAVWEKINSTRLTSKVKLDLGDWLSSRVVICLLLLWLYRLARVKVWGDNYRLAGRYFCFIKLILKMVNLRHTFHMHYL